MAAACLACAACGGGEDAGQPRKGGGELTVTLPPTLPTETVATDAAPPAPAPQAGFETVAAAGPEVKAAAEPTRRAGPREAAAAEEETAPEVEVTVAPAEEPAPNADGPTPTGTATIVATTPAAPGAAPAGASAWAGYLRRAGFACGQIASVAPVQRASSAGLAYYKVDCAGGGSYQATNKRGHLYFRRWRG
jgi:hypothetical protein